MKFYSKVFAIVLCIFCASCKESLKRPITALYNNKELLFNVELSERDNERYYGILKIANISHDDLALSVDHENIFLVCDDKEYEIYRDERTFGIMTKSREVYIKQSKILYWNVVINSKAEMCNENYELKLGKDSYQKVKIYDRVIDQINSPKDIINKMGNDKKYRTIFIAS